MVLYRQLREAVRCRSLAKPSQEPGRPPVFPTVLGALEAEQRHSRLHESRTGREIGSECPFTEVTREQVVNQLWPGSSNAVIAMGHGKSCDRCMSSRGDTPGSGLLVSEIVGQQDEIKELGSVLAAVKVALGPALARAEVFGQHDEVEEVHFAIAVGVSRYTSLEGTDVDASVHYACVGFATLIESRKVRPANDARRVTHVDRWAVGQQRVSERFSAIICKRP